MEITIRVAVIDDVRRPQGAPTALPYPILRRLSSPSHGGAAARAGSPGTSR